MVVFSKNPVYSVLYLIITFFCIAGHYLLLNAQFLAVVHVIVYAGAIMVLFLYVIMLLNLNEEAEPHKGTILRITATICVGLLMIVLIGHPQRHRTNDATTIDRCLHWTREESWQSYVD